MDHLFRIDLVRHIGGSAWYVFDTIITIFEATLQAEAHEMEALLDFLENTALVKKTLGSDKSFRLGKNDNILNIVF